MHSYQKIKENEIVRTAIVTPLGIKVIIKLRCLTLLRDYRSYYHLFFKDVSKFREFYTLENCKTPVFIENKLPLDLTIHEHKESREF
jgi:hypothetical protein